MELDLTTKLKHLYPNLKIIRYKNGDHHPVCRADGDECTPAHAIFRKITLDSDNSNLVTDFNLTIETLAGCSWCPRNKNKESNN